MSIVHPSLPPSNLPSSIQGSRHASIHPASKSDSRKNLLIGLQKETSSHPYNVSLRQISHFMGGEIESREVTRPCRADKQQVQDTNLNLYPQNIPHLTHMMGDRAINMYLGTFSLFAVFFFFFLSHRASTPHVPTLTLFSLLTSVALGPVTPVTCAVPGPPLSPPPPSSPWVSDRRG